MTLLTPVPGIAHDAWAVWDRFLIGHPEAGFRQSSWWAAERRLSGRDPFGTLIRSQGAIVGGGVVHREPLSATQAVYRIPDGPILPTDPTQVAGALRAILSVIQHRRRNEPVTISRLRIEPHWTTVPTALIDMAPLQVGALRAYRSIDLRVSETSLLAGMTSDARGHVAFGRQLGVEIVGDSSEVGIVALRRLAGPHPPGAESEALLPLLRVPGRGGIYFAVDGDIPVAGAAMVIFGGKATLVELHTRGGRGNAIGSTLLLFELMRRARSQHCASFGFEIPSDPHANAEVLRSLGGAAEGRVPPLDLLLDGVAIEAGSASE